MCTFVICQERLLKGLSEFSMLEDSLFKQKEYTPLETVTVLVKLHVVSRTNKKMLNSDELLKSSEWFVLKFHNKESFQRFRGLCYLDNIKHLNNIFFIKFCGYSSWNSVFMSLGIILHTGSVTGSESLAKLFASFLFILKKQKSFLRLLIVNFPVKCAYHRMTWLLPLNIWIHQTFQKYVVLLSSGCPVFLAHKIGNLHTKKKWAAIIYFVHACFMFFVTVPETLLYCLC